MRTHAFHCLPEPHETQPELQTATNRRPHVNDELGKLVSITRALTLTDGHWAAAFSATRHPNRQLVGSPMSTVAKSPLQCAGLNRHEAENAKFLRYRGIQQG